MSIHIYMTVVITGFHKCTMVFIKFPLLLLETEVLGYNSGVYIT